MKIRSVTKRSQRFFARIAVSKNFAFIIFLLVLGSINKLPAQTSPFNFTSIPLADPDIIAPGRGAEQWNNGSQGISYPQHDFSQQSLDVYYRFTWNMLEGAQQGSYTWNEFDGLMKSAINKGQKISFGIMSCYPDDDGRPGMVYYDDGNSAYPEYLHRLMQSEYEPDWKTNGYGITWGHGSWVPNWNSKFYLARLRALHEALYAHIKSTSYTATAGPHQGKTIAFRDVVFAIDIRGYGSWGEWHSSGIIDQMISYPLGRRPTTATLKTIIDHHADVFTDHALSMMLSAFDGERLFNTLTPKEIGAYILQGSNNWGKFGWRRDSWGARDNYFDAYLKNNLNFFGTSGPFNSIIMERWKDAPVTGEPLPGLDNNCSYGDIEAQVKEYHATSIGNGNYGSYNLPFCTQEHLRAAMKASGYRIILEGGNVNSSIQSGSSFALTLNWKNIGVAPTYEKWDVLFELKDDNNNTVWSDVSEFSPGPGKNATALLPSDAATIIEDNFSLSAGIPAGEYSLNLIIKDPTGYRAPLPLAIQGRNDDGSYTLTNIIVKEQTSDPVVPAPAPPPVPPTTEPGVAKLTGTVNLQGRPAAPDAQWQVPVNVDIYTSSNSTLVGSYLVVLDANGQFVIDSITPGVYHIAVKNSHTLKRINLSDTLIAGNNNVYFDMLPEGDVNNDNQVTIADSLLLVNNFYKVESDVTFDQQSDLNKDGITDSLDLALLLSNYDAAGDSITEGCPLSTATISNTAGCNDQPVELVLSEAQGTGPFDLVINGITYNDIPVGGTITTVDDETIWPNTPSASSDLDNPVELGVKFSSSEAGFVKGVRFFSANQIRGTYLGHLWSLDGNLLASAEFTNVTANGWQQVLFSEPVAIAPNTIYIASYHTSAGIYASTEAGLLGGVYNGRSLTVPNDNIEGGNSVYTYQGPGFPNYTYRASNYWVDVVFTKGPSAFELTSVTSSTGCNNTRQLQTLIVSSADCQQVQQRGTTTTSAIMATAEPAVDKNAKEARLMDGLSQNYPNPFAHETIINYTLAKPSKVNLSVFDLHGRLVKILVNASRDAGQHNARIGSGSLAAGIYYYKLQTENYSAVKKMIIQ